MTNNERAAVQKFINKVSELDRISDETLATLKDMNEAHGDGHRWCSWKAKFSLTLQLSMVRCCECFSASSFSGLRIGIIELLIFIYLLKAEQPHREAPS